MGKWTIKPNFARAILFVIIFGTGIGLGWLLKSPTCDYIMKTDENGCMKMFEVDLRSRIMTILDFGSDVK